MQVVGLNLTEPCFRMNNSILAAPESTWTSHLRSQRENRKHSLRRGPAITNSLHGSNWASPSSSSGSNPSFWCCSLFRCFYVVSFHSVGTPLPHPKNCLQYILLCQRHLLLANQPAGSRHLSKLSSWHHLVSVSIRRSIPIFRQ